jgi:NAD(P)-dependent dehydrogenase (short-subunit alcohol dehydrogenase family)
VLPLSGLFSFSKTSAVKIAVFSEKAEPEGVNEYYENKVAVVTGGASGIGLALSELILSSGGRAVVIADLNAEKLVTEVDRLKATHPGKVLGCHTDITEQESVAAMIRSAAEFGAGHIHFLFNNAGLGLTKSFDETSDADWKFAFDVNFFGPLYGIRAVLPIMRAQGGGHIANTASGIGFAPMAYQSMYSATKSALIGLTGALRYELWDENIRLSTVIPGTVDTPIWEKAGGAPDSAISAEQAARGILRGVAANERIVVVTEADRRGAINAFHPDRADAVDEYLLSVARKRKRGETAV